MDRNDILNQKYCQKLEKIDRNIDLALSEIATCLKSFLPNEQSTTKRKDRRAVQEVKELIPFVQNILQFFHGYPNDNFEELLLPHVGEIRQQNSLPLIDDEQLNPCKNCEFDENDQTTILLENDEGMSPKLAWNMLCWHLEKYIQRQLSIQTESDNFDPKMGRCTWQYYLQKLSNVLSPERLWEFHIHLRTYQLRFYKCPCFGDESNLNCFDCLVSLCVNNYIEDTKFLTTGSFGQLVITRDDLYSMYARKISSFVNLIFDNIEEYNKSPLATGLIRQMKCFHVRCGNNINHTTSINETKFPETILLRIIELLDNFERKTLGFSNSVTQSYLNLNDLLVSLPTDSPEQSPIHQPTTTTVLNDKDNTGTWNWRLVLVEKGFLNLLQRKLHNSISESVMEACQTEWKIFLETRSPRKIEMVIDGNYRVMNSAVVTINLLDNYKPLLASSYGALFPFCASFCHVIHTYLVDLIDHVKKISENAAVDCCYLSLYTCVYLIEKLSVYSNFCTCGRPNSNGESQLQLLIGTVESQLLEWIDFLKLRITTHHLKAILCGILQDCDSNNFEESKSFFENERISHCLTVWNVYVKRLLHDMKQCLPPDITYDLYGKILKDSVNHLTARYSKVKPSESRTVQLRTDITFLLYCVSEFLPYLTESLNEYLGITDILKPNIVVKEIHSNCCSLLIILAVVTSPLGALCKIYKNGFPQLQDNVISEGGKSNWLTWVHPILFRQSKDGNLISSTNVWLTTKICISRQNMSVPSLVLRSVTLHTCTLSILLMTQASKLPPGEDERKLSLATAILTLLKYSRHKPRELGLVLIPVINSCENWNIFDGHLVINSTNVKKPWWYVALTETILQYLQNSIGSSLTNILRLATVLNSSMITEWKSVYLHLRQVVRCTCNETQVIDRDTAIYQLALKLLQSLVESISGIPQTIILCLVQLQEYINESNSMDIKPIRNCVGLQVLLDIVCNNLINDNFLEVCLGQKATLQMKLVCNDVANCLINLIVIKDDNNSKTVPLWATNESNQFLKQIESTFANKLDNYQVDSEDDENIRLMLTDVLRDAKGVWAIEYLHEIMRGNATWIRSSLGIPGFLSSDLVVSSVCPSPLPPLFKSTGEDSESLCLPEDDSVKENNNHHRSTPPFNTSDNENTLNLNVAKNIESKIYIPLNILDEFDKIGDEPYTYDKISNVKHFWEALLSHLPYMGLTEEGFKGLLSNRWDINNEKLLTEGEKRGVQILRSRYGLDKQKPTV